MTMIFTYCTTYLFIFSAFFLEEDSMTETGNECRERRMTNTAGTKSWSYNQCDYNKFCFNNSYQLVPLKKKLRISNMEIL